MTFLGILLVILGILAIAAPLFTGLSVALLLGLLLLAAGITKVVWAVRDRRGVGSILWGVLTLLTGAFILARPGVALASLTLLLAAYFLVSGITEAWLAFQVKPERGWGWTLFGGIVSLVLGLMIWTGFPTSAVWLVGTLVGIKLLFSGMTLLTLKRAINRVSDAVRGA